MRFAIGGIHHETNSFLPPVTAPISGENAGNSDTITLVRAAFGEVELLPLGWHRFAPSGPLRDPFLRDLLEKMKAALEAADPVDALLVQLHGAMATDEDGEADAAVLIELRSCLPFGVPLVATVDRRANLSPLLVTSCDLLIGPATGETDREEPATTRAVRILQRMLHEELRPTMALARPPILPDAADPNLDGPWEKLLAPLAEEALAVPGVLDVTLTAGSAATDHARTGMGVMVVTDSDPELAANVAADLAEEIWHLREPLTSCRRTSQPANESGRPYENVRRPLYPLDLW